jgi:DNA-binding transcriptional LysR family regulator
MQGAANQITELGTGSGTGLSGTLRVSVSEGFGMWFVARHLARFTEQFPDLGVDLVATSGFLNPSRREADLAVLLARPASGPVMSGKLSDYSLGLFGSASYVERRGHPAAIADLHRHDLVGYIPDLLYAPELRYLGEIDQGLSPTLRSSSINAQYQLVANGAGIGVLPHFIGAADPTLVAILPTARIVRSFWIVAHRDTHQLRRVRAFRSWLIDLCRERRHDLLRD